MQCHVHSLTRARRYSGRGPCAASLVQRADLLYSSRRSASARMNAPSRPVWYQGRNCSLDMDEIENFATPYSSYTKRSIMAARTSLQAHL
jgi:hypothetical protein